MSDAPAKKPRQPLSRRGRLLLYTVRVTLLVSIVVVGAYVWLHAGQKTYYDDLARACAQLKDRSCCWMSVAAMREGHHQPVGIGPNWHKVCPSGESPHTLLCPSSFTWCAPTVR